MQKGVFYVMLLLLLHAGAQAQQDPMWKFTKTYFRSNPFIGHFSDFLEHVMHDPQLVNKRTQYRTDSTLFRFTGTYTSFNPFGFKPQRVDVALVEENIVLYEDRPQGDTIMVYTIIAYGDSTEKGLNEVRNEYLRIDRKTKRYFADSEEEDLSDSVHAGAGTNYFVDYSQLSPVSVEWITGLVRQPLLRVTIRVRNRGNESVLPMSLDDYKPVYSPEDL